MTTINQKEYLKKYLGIGKAPGEKKKKKKKIKVGDSRLKVIDDDIDIVISREIEQDISAANEDAPQVVAVIDERPIALQIDEKTNSSLWKPLGGPSNTTTDIHSLKLNSFKLSKQVKSSDSQIHNFKVKNERVTETYSKHTSKNKVSTITSIKQENDTDFYSRNKRETLRSPSRKLQRDITPPQKKYEEYSPPRRKNRESSVSPSRKNEDVDRSPPRRRNKKDDNSPSRRTNEDTSSFGRINRNNSPSKKINEGDSSPPRKRKGSNSFSPRKRNEDDNSPSRRRNKEGDISPPRRKARDENSPKRKSDDTRNSKFSPSRKHKDDHPLPKIKVKSEDEDVSPSRKTKRKGDRIKKTRWNPDEPPESFSSNKIRRTLDGKQAGLQNAQDLVKETKYIRQKEDEMFRNMSEEVSGRNAATVIRGKKNKDLEEEEAARKERQKEMDEKYNRWGKGLKQVENQNKKVEEQLHEMSKPLARYADDEDLEKFLKEQEREGDPMLDYIRKKKRKEKVSAGIPEKPMYMGEFMPNRFGIRPGYRWDGVDRSNGYEKKWFQVQNEEKANREEAFKWSTEDM